MKTYYHWLGERAERPIAPIRQALPEEMFVCHRYVPPEAPDDE